MKNLIRHKKTFILRLLVDPNNSAQSEELQGLIQAIGNKEAISFKTSAALLGLLHASLSDDLRHERPFEHPDQQDVT